LGECGDELAREVSGRHCLDEEVMISPENAGHRVIKDAHKAVDAAVESGKLIRPASCERRHSTPPPAFIDGHEHSQIQAHHEDYDQPLYVQWLCTRCHRIRHGKERPRATYTARQIVLRWCTAQLMAARIELQEIGAALLKR
jgi:hypothetical protein